MNRDIPENLDWVTERAQCNPFAVLEALRIQVGKDVAARNLLTPEHGFPRRSFTLQEQASWFAVVMPDGGSGSKGIMFNLTDAGVAVKDVKTRTLLHEAVLTLSDDGKCRLRVGTTEYNSWQFRKLALHDLFFVDKEIVL